MVETLLLFHSHFISAISMAGGLPRALTAQPRERREVFRHRCPASTDTWRPPHNGERPICWFSTLLRLHVIARNRQPGNFSTGQPCWLPETSINPGTGTLRPLALPETMRCARQIPFHRAWWVSLPPLNRSPPLMASTMEGFGEQSWPDRLAGA